MYTHMHMTTLDIKGLTSRPPLHTRQPTLAGGPPAHAHCLPHPRWPLGARRHTLGSQGHSSHCSCLLCHAYTRNSKHKTSGWCSHCKRKRRPSWRGTHRTGSHDTDRVDAFSCALTWEGGIGHAASGSDDTLHCVLQGVPRHEDNWELRARREGEVDTCLEREKLDLGEG